VAEAERDAAPRDLVEDRLELRAGAVEGAHGGARAKPQHLAGVVSGVLRQLDPCARRRRGDVEARDVHGAAS
jgi:hypothetical protein